MTFPSDGKIPDGWVKAELDVDAAVDDLTDCFLEWSREDGVWMPLGILDCYGEPDDCVVDRDELNLVLRPLVLWLAERVRQRGNLLIG